MIEEPNHGSDTVNVLDYLPYAITDKHVEYLYAIERYGTRHAAAHALGVHHSTINSAFERIKANAAKQGYSPEHGMTKTVPDGFLIRGISTLYGKDDEVTQQWVKTSIDAERQKELMKAAMDAFASELPRATPTPPRPINLLHESGLRDDLLNLYVLTDYHLGMKAWHEETRGDDWDIQLAEDLIYGWIENAISRSPNTERAVFAQIGDFLHWDGLDAVTPTNRHLLDADTRFQKVVRIAIRIIRRIITRLLQKHSQVHIIMADANHDPASSVWLREWLAVYYENEPRITVDLSADTYYCYEFGKTSLFFHHGHKKNVTNVDDVFASKFRDVFGRTQFSYAHMGHRHHIQAKETNLMLVEQHRTLAAHDAYASRGGWMADRDAKVITYAKNYGEVSRITITPDMLVNA